MARIAEEMGTPALVRELVEIKQADVRAAFNGTMIPLVQHMWLSEVVNELRRRSVLD